MAIQSACAESKEERVLPLLSPLKRSQYETETRSDTIPRFYAEMSGEELDRRIAAAQVSIFDDLVALVVMTQDH